MWAKLDRANTPENDASAVAGPVELGRRTPTAQFRRMPRQASAKSGARLATLDAHSTIRKQCGFYQPIVRHCRLVMLPGLTKRVRKR